MAKSNRELKDKQCANICSFFVPDAASKYNKKSCNVEF